MKKKDNIYKISFINKAQVYELYATEIYSSEMFGFITIKNLLFDNNKGVVIDPTEEKLKAEFKDVISLFLPQQQIIRIEEVKNKRSCKITALQPTDKKDTFSIMTGHKP